MNRYPLWLNIFILVILAVGVIYALPNLFGEDPSLQISSTRTEPLDAGVEKKIAQTLAEAGLRSKSIERTDGHILVRFQSEESQSKANEAVGLALGSDYVTALNLAPATPGWLRALGAGPMFLGLDLRGGVHFLLEVDMAAVLRQTQARYIADIRTRLREEKIRYRRINASPKGGIVIPFRDAAARDQTDQFISKEFPGLSSRVEDQGEDFLLLLQFVEQTRREAQEDALQQNIATLRNRVNELGVAQPVIQQQGVDRIVVQLPGVQDTTRAKEILGAATTLEFRMVDTEHDVREAVSGKVPVTSKLYRERDGDPILLKDQVMLTGEYIIGAAPGIDQQSGAPAVFVTLDGTGAKMFQRATREQVGRPMATVFIENKTDIKREAGKIVRTRKKVEEVVNVATIREEPSERFQISGLDSTKEALDLALLLRAGALAAPVQILEERTVGPSLGRDNINKGLRSVIIGFCLVLLFMAVYYRLFGVVADIALAVNLVLIVALLSMLSGFGATLTLPGIAGIVLTVGMAVDANVLIFERIREELKSGNTPQASIHAGYSKALSTIADANITILIAALVLFGYGTGPIKGFAVTLSLGIITSMFTAIMGTRALINVIYGGRRVLKLPI